MAKSTAKRQRKFEKNHLKETLERRDAGKKIRQKQQIKSAKAARKARDAEFGVGIATNENGEDAPKNSVKQDPLAKMSVDDFFAGGFEVPKTLSKKLPKVVDARKRKRGTEEEEEEEEKEEDEPNDELVDKTMADSLMNGDENDEEAESSDVSSLGDEIHDDSDSSSEVDDDDNEKTMAATLQKDPEFAKYLKENDPDAYNEAMGLNEPEINEDEEVKASVPENKKQAKKSKKQKTETDVSAFSDEEVDEIDGEDDLAEVTSAMVAKWKKAMSEQFSLRAMRQAVTAFRAAAHINEDEAANYKYTISNPEVYHELLVVTLTYVPEVLQHHLPVKESAAGKVRVSTDNKKFKTLTPLLKSHTTSVQHLLASLSDASTLKLTLQSIIPMLPYLLSFKKVLKDVVKTVVDIWSDASSTEATRITAFLVIRRLSVIGDPGLREAVLKTVYQGLLTGAR